MNSSLVGMTKAVTSDVGSQVRIANSMVSGTVTGDGITCIGSYDYDFGALNSTCQ